MKIIYLKKIAKPIKTVYKFMKMENFTLFKVANSIWIRYTSFRHRTTTVLSNSFTHLKIVLINRIHEIYQFEIKLVKSVRH